MRADPKPEPKEKRPRVFIKKTPLKIERKSTGEGEIMKEIANEREHKSIISGEPVYEIGYVNMAHVLSKKQYPKFRLNKDNIVILTQREHELYDFGTKEQREQYAEQMLQWDIVVDWQKMYDLAEVLKEKYKLT